MSTNSQLSPTDRFQQRVRHYKDVLDPLFDASPYRRADRLFEFVCTILRVSGTSGAGWDPWDETQAVLEDLKQLMVMAQSVKGLADPDRTEMRLALLAYCHITEIDLSYFLLTNLLRVRLDKRYDLSPFSDLARPIKNKKAGGIPKFKPPMPSQKIRYIKELAVAANMPQIIEALEEIYDPIIRNAVYHSNYVLKDEVMHLFSDYRLSKTERVYTRVVKFEELAELIDDAFAFYTALVDLYDRARRVFVDFKNAFIPFDLRLKGIMEFLFNSKDSLAGFRMYWPNGSMSYYTRDEQGSRAVNLHFNPDRSINFFVNLYASTPGSFSPLVEHDAQPIYAKRPGTDVSPYWPTELAVYKIPENDTVTLPAPEQNSAAVSD